MNSAGVVAILVFLSSSTCCGVLRSDDGQEYDSDTRELEPGTDGRMSPETRQREVDYRDVATIVVIHVVDEKGNPINHATMDVRFFFDDLFGRWEGLRASNRGSIAFFSTGYFGPKRTDIYVIRANGFIPRMLKKISFDEGRDRIQPIREKEWNMRTAEYAAGIADATKIKRPYVDMEYLQTGGDIRVCYRQIVLRRKP